MSIGWGFDEVYCNGIEISASVHLVVDLLMKWGRRNDWNAVVGQGGSYFWVGEEEDDQSRSSE
jgi:hypothetical protein